VTLLEMSAGATLDVDALSAHCRASLSGYKVPKRFVALPSLQRSPAGKADYNLLRGLAASEVSSL
jgi:acyl-CoA synthetase (AMP-forming)/AMP-acid ligase II